MQVLYERCAAVDVGKDVIAVAVRLPGDGPDGRATLKRTFKTFYGVLREAARWLASLGVTHVAMEATGIYSMPVYHALIEHGEFEQVLVCNAGHVKNVPGRKTDLADAEWLVHLLECGLLRGQLHPARGHQGRPGRHPVPHEGRAVADLGAAAAGQRAPGRRDQDRLGGLLHRHQVRPGDDRGADRRGTPPRVLADLAKGKMRAKIPDLSMALEGRFGDHHALMCRLHLDHIDHLEAMIAKLDAQIEAMMAPFRAQRDLLTTIPGIGPLAAAAVISEIGASVTEYFPDAAHLASWAGLCPGNHESAGKRHSGKRRHGNQHLQPVLVEAAWAAVRHQGYLKALYHRHVMKWGGYRSPTAKKKAIIVVAHAMLVIIWHVLADRQALRRARRRLLHPPPGPRAGNPPPDRQARSPRPPGHPPASRLTQHRPPRPEPTITSRGSLPPPGGGPFSYQLKSRELHSRVAAHESCADVYHLRWSAGSCPPRRRHRSPGSAGRPPGGPGPREAARL